MKGIRFKKGHIPWNKGMKGFKQSEIHNERTRLARLGKKHSEATRKKMLGRKNTLGKHWKTEKHTKEHKEKIRLAMTGKKHTEKTKKKMGLAHKGEKSHFWQGGKSFELYSVNWTETLRRAIRERDNYICQLCSQYGDNVHHKDYNKKNCNPENLITLCRKCNIKVNFNREYWIDYFNNLSGLLGSGS